jgi:hypothetical protein
MRKVYNWGVPNQRRSGQTFLGLQISTELFHLVNLGRKELRMDRSTFVRESIAEKLRSLGFEVPASIIDPPDRADRGEQPPVPVKPVSVTTPYVDEPEPLPRAAETTEVVPTGPKTKTNYRKSKKR